MKLKIVLFFVIALSPLFSFGQGSMTIFSEDGDKFFLVLNGVKQNYTPQANVHVDGLNGDFYSGKIIFEDASKPEISKNLPTKDAATGQFVEWTYKIKKTKDGDLKLRIFGSTPVPVNYNPPPDMYVAHYGQPAPQPANTVTQTTVTTTQQNNNGGASITINPGGGMNMNVNVVDPNGTTTTQTTTTTTYANNDGAGQQQPAASQCLYPMDFKSYKAAKISIMNASFEETKLSTAKAVISSNCLTTEQVIDICMAFGFEASKLDFAKAAYTRTTDPANYFQVGTIFSFDASKNDLNSYISSHSR
jgi:hypothetical protein